MAFGWGSHSDKARLVSLEDLEARFAAAGFDTGYYNPEVHKAAFALPNYVKKLFP